MNVVKLRRTNKDRIHEAIDEMFEDGFINIALVAFPKEEFNDQYRFLTSFTPGTIELMALNRLVVHLSNKDVVLEDE